MFGRKSDHPMSDIKSAQALLADLPRTDAIKSVMELTDWMESVLEPDVFRLADQFAVLSLLDETAQLYARKLACEYFSLPDLHTFHGNRLCLLLGKLARQTADAYVAMFERYCNGDGAAIKPQLPLLVARAVRAMREQLKFAAVHYQPHDNNVWRNFSQLYRHAEQQRYLDMPLNLYPAQCDPVSVQLESAQLLAWFACGINSLSPRTLHLTERIIASYGTCVEITPILGKKALFSFDLAYPLDPARVDLEATLHPLMRYIGMADMQVRLEALVKSLDKNSIPAELNLAGVFAVEWVMDAAQHLLSYLVAPPLRLSKRRELKTSLDVVCGYDNLCCVHAGLELMHWELENASSCGFCAAFSGRGADRVHIGSVLGLPAAGGSRMGAAVVRHMSRDVAGRLHVGAEMLANAVSGVTLVPGSGSGFTQSALWLHARSGADSGAISLLMPADTFSMQRSYKTHFDDRNYLLIPGSLQEKGPDYDLASFRIIEQEEAES